VGLRLLLSRILLDGAMTEITSAVSSPWRRIFRNPRELRAGWRFAIFLTLLTVLSLGGHVIASVLHYQPEEGWTAGAFLFAEFTQFALTCVAVALMGRLERRSLARYGLPLQGAFGRHFWAGALWGGLAVCGLVGLIALFGGYSVSGLALTGGALLRSAVLWAVTMVLLGLYEELLFRGYPQLTLATGMGFWAAALLISASFSAVHYFFKPMENIADALSVGLIGLFLCLTLRRTGSLWWAIGFHFAFDYAALVVFGAPNTGNDGQSIADHLLASSWHGPDWLTGGPRGAEASLLVFVVIAALFALFSRIYRTTRFPLPPDQRPAA
jgi:CAAX protease family protein